MPKFKIGDNVVLNSLGTVHEILSYEGNGVYKITWADFLRVDCHEENLSYPTEENMPEYDVVNKPAHYNQGGIECIEYIRQVLGDEGFVAYCQGNTIKYLHRHKYKGKPLEDLRKASYYLNKMIETLEGTYND